MRKSAVVLALCFTAILFLHRSTAQVGTVRTTWEYKIVELPTGYPDAEKQLNELGSEGWELVTVHPHAAQEQSWGEGKFILKRLGP